MSYRALRAGVVLLLAGCGPRSAPEPAPRTPDTEHVEAMAREHAHDDAGANAAAQPPAQDVVTRMVSYASVAGQPINGYLARPMETGGQPLPAILVIHEWWGLNDNVRMMTRRLAGEGYTALAVDLYGGRAAEEPQAARALMMGVTQNPEPAVENLRQAAAWLRREERAPKLATLGWCFGGGWSLRAGLALPEQVDAVVIYYGQPISDPERLRPLDAPVLGLFGAEDAGIPVAEVRSMESALAALGKPATIQVYEGADHGFANPSGRAYNAAAADDAWRRTTAFLAQHLKGAMP